MIMISKLLRSGVVFPPRGLFEPWDDPMIQGAFNGMQAAFGRHNMFSM